MNDLPDKHSAGTMLLTAWAARRMRWSDVAVEKDETTYALVQKDTNEERGKRLCASGSIIEIEAVEAADNRKMHRGLLMTSASKVLSFIAVASTGSLADESEARICGVVTGKFDYTKSAGGTGHAIDMVGMFDLPENHPRGVKTAAQ